MTCFYKFLLRLTCCALVSGCSISPVVNSDSDPQVLSEKAQTVEKAQAIAKTQSRDKKFSQLVKPRDRDKYNKEGYRIGFYRSKIPGPPDGITALSDQQFFAKIAQYSSAKKGQCKLSLIDVSPDRNAVFFADDEGGSGEWITSAQHKSIQESVWLINVGFGEPEPSVQHYFEQSLLQISQSNKECPMVFFCIGDCWMAWNASRRALRLGYRNLYWYNNGIDGWKRHGKKLQAAQPYVLKKLNFKTK